MKKICFFVGDITRSGGTERVTCLIANYLIDNGYEVSILSIKSNGTSFFELNTKVKCESLFNNECRGLLRFPLVIRKLRHYIVNNQIDLLIAVESMLSLFVVPASMFLKVKKVCWEHFNYNIDLGKKTRRLARYLAAKFCDIVVVLTDKDKQMWKTKFSCKAKIVRIYNPVSFEIDNVNVNDMNKVAISVGRLSHQKGYDLLLEIWSKKQEKYSDWKLFIIGDGEDADKLNELCDYYKLFNSVTIVPRTKNIDQFYQRASLYLMSSRYEGFPMVLLEAQEYGLPIISFDCDTGPSELLTVNKTGWLVEDGIAGYVSCLNKTLGMFTDHNEQYKHIRMCAKENAKLYHMDRIGPQWLKLLESEKND